MSAYITLEDAELFVAANIISSAAWDAATDPLKTKALLVATKKIDMLNFVGEPTVAGQSLQFPRGGDATVPQQIKDATVYLALRLLDDVDPEREFENQFMSAFQYENIKSTYDRSRVAVNVTHGIPSWEAWIRIQPFLYDASAVKMTRLD
jgi:hypothetical protein